MGDTLKYNPNTQEQKNPLEDIGDDELGDILEANIAKAKVVPDTGDSDPLANFNTEDKLAIVEQAMKNVEAELQKREAEEAKNANVLTKMRASIEKNVGAAEMGRQKEAMRRILIDTEIERLAAEKSNAGKKEAIDISDDELDDAFNKLG
jgi:cysteinyl-tRNA synthetase